MKLVLTIALLAALTALLAGPTAGLDAAVQDPVIARIDVGAEAWTLAAAKDGSVWSDGGRGVLRIDPTSNRITVRTRVSGTANAGGGAVWVPSGRTLYRLHPTTGAELARIPLTRPGESALVQSGVVWVTSPDTASLMRVDLAERRVVATIPACDAKWGGVAAAGGSIWLACYVQGELLRIDPSTNRVSKRIRLAYGLHSLTVGAGSIWVNNRETARVARVNVATNRVVANIRTSANPSIVFARGMVWAGGDGAVLRIDPASNRVTGRLPVAASESYGLAYAAGSLWLSTIGDRRVLRLEPSRITK